MTRAATGETALPALPASELRVQQAFEHVRRAILRGELTPGEPISQVKLAERLGISRTPLREALRMLEREGLIQSEPNRRVRVPPLSLEDLEQLYANRIVLEALAVRLTVPHLTEAELARLGTLLGEMEEHGGGHDLERWAIPHREFHDLLRAHAGARVQRLAREVADHSERYHRVHMAEPRSWSSAAVEHAAIVAACRAGDERQAACELASHMARTPLSIIAVAHPEHDPVVVRTALRSVLGD